MSPTFDLNAPLTFLALKNCSNSSNSSQTKAPISLWQVGPTRQRDCSYVLFFFPWPHEEEGVLRGCRAGKGGCRWEGATPGARPSGREGARGTATSWGLTIGEARWWWGGGEACRAQEEAATDVGREGLGIGTRETAEQQNRGSSIGPTRMGSEGRNLGGQTNLRGQVGSLLWRGFFLFHY